MFFPAEEYPTEAVEQELQQLGVMCSVLPDLVPTYAVNNSSKQLTDSEGKRLAGFSMKSAAVLLSSFEEVHCCLASCCSKKSCCAMHICCSALCIHGEQVLDIAYIHGHCSLAGHCTTTWAALSQTTTGLLEALFVFCQLCIRLEMHLGLKSFCLIAPLVYASQLKLVI